MGDISVSVVVLDGGSRAKVVDGKGNKKTLRGGDYGKGLGWQAAALLVASVFLVLAAATLWIPRHVLRHHPRARGGGGGGGTDGDNKHDSGLIFGEEPEIVGCRHVNCETATCRGLRSLAEMQQAVINMKCETLSGLVITSSSLGVALEKDWLPTSVQVTDSITLDRLDLTDIDADAFTGAQLSAVSTVVLSNLQNVTSLRREIFRPFGHLEGIRLENLYGLVSVDPGIVSNLASATFHDLQFTSDATSIADLIPSFTGGGISVPHLVKVIYRGDIGTLRAEHLEALNLNGVAMVVLQDAGITSIESGALVREAGGVEQMILAGNKLTTISRDAIDVAQFRTKSVFLKNNSWDCACPLAWLLEFKDRIGDNPVCETPAEMKGKEIKTLEVDDLCVATVTPTPPEETTTDPGTTTPATTAPPEETTPPPHTESCVEAVVRDLTEDFRVDRILTETPDGEVLVSVPDPFSNQILEWSGNDGNCFQVDVGERRAFVVSGLRPSTSYTFCFLDGVAVVISRCFPITLLPSEDERAWLTNGVKIKVIVGVVVGFLFAVVLPVAIIVAVLRQWPQFLGNRIILVPWHRKEKVLVMPRGYREQRRRASTSTGSDTATYVTPDSPTKCELASYYVGRVGRRLGNAFRRRGGDDFPPPPFRPRKPSAASTVTSDEGRCWPDATEPPPPAWYRRPDLRPWTSRPRGFSATSGI